MAQQFDCVLRRLGNVVEHHRWAASLNVPGRRWQDLVARPPVVDATVARPSEVRLMIPAHHCTRAPDRAVGVWDALLEVDGPAVVDVNDDDRPRRVRSLNRWLIRLLRR